MTASRPDAPRAVIAEDEPLLAAELASELHQAWPALQIAATAADGESAVEQVLALQPEVVFLDIRMPGLSGLQAAEAIAEDWPDGVVPPLVVFVTAYDQYAVQAFERAAFDYLLKPVQPERLRHTVARLQAALASRGTRAAPAPLAMNELVERLEQVMAAGGGANAATTTVEPLRVLQIGVGNQIRMVPVDDVLVFEAADKYVRVLTAGGGEHLIRLSLRELLPRLDAGRFWQIHRGTVVRAEAIESATRDESGKVTLQLRGRTETFAVSRVHAARFKAM